MTVNKKKKVLQVVAVSLIVLTVVAFLPFSGLLSQAAENLVKNSSFETSKNWGTQKISDWTLDQYNDGQSASKEMSHSHTANGYNGKGIWWSKSGENNGSYGIMTSDSFPVTAGKEYISTVMLRLEQKVGESWIVTRVMFYDSSNKLIGNSHRADDHRTHSEEWQQQIGYYTAPDNAVTAKIELYIRGTAFECWVDDVVFRENDATESEVKSFEKGWTTTSGSNDVEAVTDTYREGTTSYHVNQTVNTAFTKIQSDQLIKVETGKRYLFTAWVKSQDCNVGTESIRLNGYTYDSDKKPIRESSSTVVIEGLYRLLNENNTPSEWQQLILAVEPTATNKIGYIRPFVQISAGKANLWLDDFSYEVFERENEFFEDFASVNSDGTPDGWKTKIETGSPSFTFENGLATITANAATDEGVLIGRWDTAMEQKDMNFAATYATTGAAQAKVMIRFYDFSDKEIAKARVEKILGSTSRSDLNYDFDFTLDSAKYMTVELSNVGSGSVSFDKVSIRSISETETTTAFNVQLDSYSVTTKAKSGEDILISASLVPGSDVKKENNLTAHLWRKGTTTDMKQFSAVLEQVQGPSMDKWKAGQAVDVQYRMTIPDYIGSGEYYIQLDKAVVKITNTEITDNKLDKTTKITQAAAAATTAKFNKVNGTQALILNGKTTPVMSYAAPGISESVRPSYSEGNTPQYMHEADICITRLWTHFGGYIMSNSAEGELWSGYGEYDWDRLDQYIYDQLAKHPDTYLMLTLGFDVAKPENNGAIPSWWYEENPDEFVITKDADGNETTAGVSFFSDKMFTNTIQANKDMIAHMKKQPYWHRIVGAVLASGQHTEWIWNGTGQVTMDYSPVAQAAFKKWVNEEYGTDVALQEAWNDPNITLATVEVPDYADTEGKTYVNLLDPNIQKNVLDYKRCMEETEAKRLLQVAQAMSETVETDGTNWIFGAYFGYLYSRLLSWDAPLKMHTNIDDVVTSPYLDFFAAPATYNERYDGEVGGFAHMADGILAQGKAVIVEDDLRLCSFMKDHEFFTRDSVGPTYNVSDSLSMLIRNYSNQLTSGLGNWYYNLEGNFFDRKAFSDVMAVMNDEHMVNLAREKDYSTEVAYILDEDVYSQMTTEFLADNAVMLEMIYEQKWELAKLGTRVSYYSMSDLEADRVPEHKVYIMLASAEMDDSEIAAVNRNLKKDGKVVLWQYICGASDGTTISAQNMSDVIGMEVTLNTNLNDLGATIKTDANHWLTDGLAGTFIGSARSRKIVTPTALVTDSEATKLADMNDDSGTALAIKEVSGVWTTVFSAVPCYTTEMLRNVLTHCNVHIYSDDLNDVIFANSNYVAVNAAYGGAKNIKLDDTYAVYDVFGQKTISNATNTITFNMEDSSTKLFRLMPANQHIVYMELGENGTSEQAGYQKIANGKDYHYQITADKEYIISELTIDGVTTTVNKKSVEGVLQEVDNSHYLEATFIKGEEPTLQDTGIKYVLMNLAEYWNETSPKAPLEDGYVFGGWYQDAFGNVFHTKESAKAAYDANETAYAKFVPAEVLSIMSQNEKEADIKQKASMRVISSVDSLRYREVGFEILVNNKNKVPNTSSVRVFSGIKNSATSVVETADQYFGPAAKYFNVWRLDNIAQKYHGKIIYARPYWLTHDGTKVEGLAKYLHMEDEYKGYINIPLNILNGEAIAAGLLDVEYDSSVFEFYDYEVGKLLPEMYANPAQEGVVRIVGNASKVDQNVKADGLYGSLRFKVKTDKNEAGHSFIMKEQKFMNWNYDAIDTLNVWDITLK